MSGVLNFDERVLIYEIEQYDDNCHNWPIRSQEDQDALEISNMKFLNEQIEDKILRDHFPCACRKGASDSTDDYNYAIILVSAYGQYIGCSAIIRECIHCHNVEYWGDLSAYAHVMANAITSFVTYQTELEMETPTVTGPMESIDTDESNPLGKDVLLTDIEPNLVTTDINMEDAAPSENPPEE